MSDNKSKKIDGSGYVLKIPGSLGFVLRVMDTEWVLFLHLAME